MKVINYRLVFAWFTSIIFLSAYFVFVSSANVFQDYAVRHHFNSHAFPRFSLIAMQIAMFITIICILKAFQDMRRQYFLMLTLLILLLSVLLGPISFSSYAALSGLSSSIFDLTEPWRQFFVPPAFRATIEGVTEGLTGFIDLGSVSIEDEWSKHLADYHYLAPLFVVLLIAFAILARKLINAKNTHTEKKIVPKSIIQLLKDYPYIFILCLFGGMNTAVFNYTLFLIKNATHEIAAKHGQYAIYAGSIILPILIGRIADKRGIFKLVLFCGFALLGVRISIAFFVGLDVIIPPVIHCLLFLLGGLSASIWTLNVALVGERLHEQGIFRAFILSNIVFEIGFMIAGSFYEYFDMPFQITKLLLTVMDCLFLLILSFYARKKEIHSA